MVLQPAYKERWSGVELVQAYLGVPLAPRIKWASKFPRTVVVPCDTDQTTSMALVWIKNRMGYCCNIKWVRCSSASFMYVHLFHLQPRKSSSDAPSPIPCPTGPERPWCTKISPERQTASPPPTGQMPFSKPVYDQDTRRFSRRTPTY